MAAEACWRADATSAAPGGGEPDAAPDAVAEAASWPVTEADKTARQIALLRWRDTCAAERLWASPFCLTPRDAARPKRLFDDG